MRLCDSLLWSPRGPTGLCFPRLYCGVALCPGTLRSIKATFSRSPCSAGLAYSSPCRLCFSTSTFLVTGSKPHHPRPDEQISVTAGTFKPWDALACEWWGSGTAASAMSIIPLHLERRFEQRWAARFGSLLVQSAPKNVGLKGSPVNVAARAAKAKEKPADSTPRVRSLPLAV